MGINSVMNLYLDGYTLDFDFFSILLYNIFYMDIARDVFIVKLHLQLAKVIVNFSPVIEETSEELDCHRNVLSTCGSSDAVHR